MSRHPSEASLALYAGDELAGFSRWRVERHLRACGECQHDVSEFSALRTEVAAANQAPELDWNPLAAEMKANIRLGLEAGECVTPGVPPPVSSLRALAACASLAVLLVVSYLLERPAPRVVPLPEAAVLEGGGVGIQVKEGQQALILLNAGGRDVSYVASGSTVRARYVDSNTGYVTINNVYVE